MKRFTKSVAGQFTIAATACIALFTLLWTLAGWVLGELVDGLPPLQK
ncbi:hypothetical protein HUT16_37195 [Kitasatospora sp. NA04385]|nr:hypothetical protein [Kitasatospora sp. NA04385]QKW23972.1 hypothetical protein HUT16_37195 [Kitasatospora sp. NA04385]